MRLRQRQWTGSWPRTGPRQQQQQQQLLLLLLLLLKLKLGL
jgi:hypothetical protein